MKKKTKTKPLSWYKKELDKWFSLYIRYKYADKEGNVLCYTCTTKKKVKEIQNGHWIPRNILATRYEEKNCRPQCVGCNMFQNGKPDVFAVNLLREGVDIEKLQQLRYKVFKVDRFWYEEKIAYYKGEVRKFEELYNIHY